MDSKLESPGTKRLKLSYDKLLSAVAFKFNLRRYTLARPAPDQPILITDWRFDIINADTNQAGAYTRRLLSST